MKAVFIDDPSTGRGLSLAEVPDPAAPSGTAVLVRVRAAGLNRADLLQAKGLYPPPPGVLFVRGKVEPADQMAVAIVGTRRATHYGKNQAERLAAGLARAGITVVSGMARGIDGVVGLGKPPGSITTRRPGRGR